MNNTIRELISFLVFVFVVHRMQYLLGLRNWGKQHLKRRHKMLHRSRRLKNKRSPKKSTKKPWRGLSASTWWRTGQWTVHVRCAPDYPVGQPDSLRREATDRRSRAVAPDCPMVHRTVITGLSDVHRTDDNCQIQRSTATGANCRLTWCAPDTAQWLSGGAPDCPVHPTTESCCFLFNG
jgi:hypothetical protein